MTKILLVEDEKMIQHLHTMVLERLGATVDLAESGEDALLSADNQYDLILMDVGLPGMSGIEAIKAIRGSNLKSKQLPIVVITGYASEEIRNACMEAGATNMLTKPVCREVFETILKEYIVQAI